MKTTNYLTSVKILMSSPAYLNMSIDARRKAVDNLTDVLNLADTTECEVI